MASGIPDTFGHPRNSPLDCWLTHPYAKQMPNPDRLRLADVAQLNEIDRRIWNEELASFVPPRVIDLHTHLTQGDFDLGTRNRYDAGGGVWSLLYQGDWSTLVDADALLMPGREVHRLVFPVPHRECNFQGSNEFIASEVKKDSLSAALMLVHPGMTAEAVDRAIIRHRFLGFKPYRWYSVTGDPVNCRVLDFMPEHILEVGNRYGLIVGLHVSKPEAIADPENLEDIERMAEKYPRLRWALFHCARSYSSWAIERAAPRLKNIPNVWYESSSVCETDAFDALFSLADPTHICYGSDDLSVGIGRGKYIAYGYCWVSMTENNQSFNTSHTDGRMTFVRYEMLRAMRRAAMHAHFTREQIEDLFHNNARRLIDDTRSELEGVLAGQEAA